MKDVVCAYSQCYKGKGGRRRRANHVCPHCHTVGYCCADCRTKDWPNHRKNCLILQKEDWKKKHGRYQQNHHHCHQSQCQCCCCCIRVVRKQNVNGKHSYQKF